MKLEPVFLVAPRPEPRSMSTRRAFIGMGLAFVGGAVVGGACGYAAGKEQGAATDASAADELRPSGNPDLDEVRRLAVKAPIEELMSNASKFLITVNRDYPEDEIVWRGVGRIAAYLVANEGLPNRRSLAHWLNQVIDNGHPDRRAQYSPWQSKLQAIR